MPSPNLSGGAQPVGAPKSQYQKIRSRLYEIAKDLSPEDYRGVAMTLKASLSTTTTSGTDTLRVPATHEFVIEQIRGHLVITLASGETYAVPNLGSSDPASAGSTLALRDRLLMKAMNCRVDLKNSDREQKIFDNQSLSLATILALTGAQPLDFGNEPHIVPAGETLIMSAALIDTTAAVVGAATEYGITLVGKLIRVARS